MTWETQHSGPGWYWVKWDRKLYITCVIEHWRKVGRDRGADLEPVAADLYCANGGSRVSWLLKDLPRGVRWQRIEEPKL